MADFSKPVTTDNYTAVLQEIRDLADSLAKLQNGTTDTNIPDGAVRWNSTNKGFEKYDAATATWGAIVTIGNQTTDDLPEGTKKFANGINSTITELTGLTTPLSKAQGGTGNTSGDAASVAGKVPTATPTANAVPIADANAKLDGWVTMPNTIKINTGTYTGNGNYNRAIAHGLGVVPKLVIVAPNSTSYYNSGERLMLIYGATNWVPLSTAGYYSTNQPNTSVFYLPNSLNYGNVNSYLYNWVAIG